MSTATKIKSYLRSTSTLYGYCIGLSMYLAYASSYGKWQHPGLIALTTFVGFFIPFYSRISNRVEELVQYRTAQITPGRALRFSFQLFFNIGIFVVLSGTRVVNEGGLGHLGGIVGVSAVTTAASQGIQYFALMLANRDIGEKNRNVLIGLSINILLTALATLGLTWAKSIFFALGLGFGSLVILIGVLSDLRSANAPQGGVGIFLGTFNPFHKTHLKIIREAIRQRNLTTVYLHSTVIPKLHADALRKGEIKIARHEEGMRVYEKTPKADVHMNYFPTGNRFYEFETRKLLMELAIQEEGMQSKVKVLSMPEAYEREGFYGIIRAVRRLHPGTRIHGIHGSDLGGMWIRNIYDECGWIYPYPVRRIDGVSATAIRKGATGMASPVVDEVITQLRENRTDLKVRNKKLKVKQGVLEYEAV